jgi:hypothetical protein
MTSLLLVVLCGGLLALWWRASIEARVRANAAALDACEQAGVQLLDGTVAFKALRAARDAHGRLALRRTYVFDYSEDGASRRHGFVILSGREVDIVGLGPTLVPGRASAA